MQRCFVVFMSPQLSCWKVPSTPLYGSPLPEAGKGGSASEPPQSQQPQEWHRQWLRVWGNAGGGRPSPTMVPWWTVARLLTASTKMLSWPHQQLIKTQFQQGKTPSWWNLPARWISGGPGAMFRRTEQMGVCLIKVDSHNGTACNSIRRLSVTG